MEVLSETMELTIWNILLSAAIAIIGFMAKGKLDHIDGRFSEVDRLGILLNKTREEIARDHVTRAEMNTTVDKLGERFDKAFERLEAKLDVLAEKK